MSIRKFKKPNNSIILVDLNVHTEEYLNHCIENFEEVKKEKTFKEPKPKQKVAKKTKKKKDDK